VVKRSEPVSSRALARKGLVFGGGKHLAHPTPDQIGAQSHDLGDNTGKMVAAAFRELGEAHALLDRHWADQLGAHLIGGVTRHHHLDVGASMRRVKAVIWPGHCRWCDVELSGGKPAKKGVWACPPSFLFEHVTSPRTWCGALDGVGLAQHHAALDVLLLNARKEQPCVITCNAFRAAYGTSLQTGDGGSAGVTLMADDLGTVSPT